MFQRSYKDTIRALEKQNEKERELLDKAADTDEKNQNIPFGHCILDISSDLEPVAPEYLMRKTISGESADYAIEFKSRVESQVESPNLEPLHVAEPHTVVRSEWVESRVSPFVELLGADGWLSKLYKLYKPDSDFLTGYYFAKYFIRHKKNPCESFHIGCESNIIYGIQYYLDKLSGHWQWFGCDLHPSEKPNIINGLNHSGDITSINSVQLIKNELASSTYNKLQFIVQDVYPHEMLYLWQTMLLILSKIASDGVAIMRIPEPQFYNLYGANFVNFMILVLTQFIQVKIFKSPFADKIKYYLILRGTKSPYTATDLSRLTRYIKEYKKNKTLLFSKKLIEQKEIQDIIEQLRRLINFADIPAISNEEANTQWLDLIFDTKQEDPTQC